MHPSIRLLLGSFSIFAFLTQSAAALAAPVSIEEVMAAPYPSSLVAVGEGKFRCVGIRYQRRPQYLGGARRSRTADHAVHVG